tara:strand:+ start:64 stop:567 length:504 start_codon:yes stop_codon:yes gene_type:complete
MEATMNIPEYKEQLEAFSTLFEAFKLIELPWQAKYQGFDRILFDSKLVDHWTIVGISYDALSLIASNGFSKTNKGVVRGHIKDRKDRASHLFTADFESTKDAFKYYIEHDKVELITKNENSGGKSPADWSKRYPLPNDIFPYRCGLAAKYTDEALSYLKALYRAESA